MTTGGARRKDVTLIVAYVVIGTFQILWHWFLTWRFASAQCLLRMYLYHDLRTGREVEGYLDLLVPCLLAGLSTGWLGWQWAFRKLALYVFFVGIRVVGLMPLYPLFLDRGMAWWWPPSTGDVILEVFKAWTTVAAFTVAGRVFGAAAHGEGRPA